MSTITIDMRNLKNTIKRLDRWVKDFSLDSLKKTSDKVATDYRKLIRAGKDGNNNSMLRVRDSTMKMPIRYGGPDKRIRGDVKKNRKPLVATGKAVESIKSTKRGDRYEIGPVSSHGKIVFGVNSRARTTNNGNNVAIRDPLVVSDRQLDIVENELLKSLDKALR